MNSLTTDYGFVSLNKHGEQLCGDRVEVTEFKDTLTLVLADGLGSGVKANILSTMTSKIVATMMANGMSIEECVQTIANTLPVCNQRKIAYSTFTIIQINNNEQASVFNFDNPPVIFMRDGKSIEYETTKLIIDNKTITKAQIDLKPDDIFVAMSDGAIYAGVGQTLNFGWQRDDIINYLESRFEPNFSAKMTATVIADECNELYNHLPGDDTTIAALKIRKKQQVNLMIGPPSNPDDDKTYLSSFFANPGKYVVCGGTTASIASNYLEKPVTTSLDYCDKSIPPIGHIEGVDLVTEGIITISRVLEYGQSYVSGDDLSACWNNKNDGASLIAQMLFETATDINFFVGRAINPAHQNPNLPISFAIKINLIEDLAKCLEKMNKKVRLTYF